MFEVVAIIDQANSRATGSTRIPPLLARLEAEPLVRARPAFAQTLGDEIQGVLAGDSSIARLCMLVLRDRDWWMGFGIGEIESRGESVLDSSGTAFRLAREAVQQAKNRPWGVAVRGSNAWATLLDDAVALYATLLLGRTAEGWEAVELKREGLRDEEIAECLSVTRQAVSKRLRTAGYRQDEAGARLVDALAGLARRDLDFPEDLGVEKP